jgi:hypothetical protein
MGTVVVGLGAIVCTAVGRGNSDATTRTGGKALLPPFAQRGGKLDRGVGCCCR